MVRKRHGMIEWPNKVSEYDLISGGSMPDAVVASIARAVRSGSQTVVFFGPEFDPDKDNWDEVIRHIERNMLDTRGERRGGDSIS